MTEEVSAQYGYDDYFEDEDVDENGDQGMNDGRFDVVEVIKEALTSLGLIEKPQESLSEISDNFAESRDHDTEACIRNSKPNPIKMPRTSMVHDVRGAYPMAAESDLKELSLRQQELVELQMMRTGENLDKINIAALDFGRAASVANPRIESTYTSWVVEGWVGRLKPIYCACESVQDVHIKHCHGTPQKKVLIELRHVCRSFLIEHCSYLSVKVNNCVGASRVLSSSGVTIVIGGETPHLYFRGVSEGEVTVCQNAMRGVITTSNCKNMSVHGVPVTGILTLDADDLCRSPVVYTAGLPSRIRTHQVGKNLISEVRGMADMPDVGELYWANHRPPARQGKRHDTGRGGGSSNMGITSPSDARPGLSRG